VLVMSAGVGVVDMTYEAVYVAGVYMARSKWSR